MTNRLMMMCAESLWWRCHRRLLADALVLLRDVDVWHLFHDGRLTPHSVTPRLVEQGINSCMTWATPHPCSLADETRAQCPFCSERIETAVPRFPPRIVPEGRIRVGEAVLFPNLLPYSQYSSVSVYSPERLFLTLSQLTPRLVAGNLAAQVAFGRAVLAADAGAPWASINANHMLPSGSSLFHPHFQGIVHRSPTNQQCLLAAVPGERWTDYLVTERRLGRRWLGELGGAEWLTAFAPVA